MFGRVKGATETELLVLSKSLPSLRVISARSGGVDPDLQPEIHPYIPKPDLFFTRILMPMLRPMFRRTWKNMTSPTKELGEVLTLLAMGEGGTFEGRGVSGEGRT